MPHEIDKHKKAIEEVNDLATKIEEQIQRKEELEKKMKAISDILPKIEEEERVKQELYKKLGRKYEGKILELRREQEEVSEKIKQIEKNVDELKKEFLNIFCQEPPPYPLLDLENPKINENQIIFPIKEGYRLSNLAYKTLLSQTWNTTELAISEVRFEENQWVVNSKEVLDAMKKVNSAIDNLRQSIVDILNADEICRKRIHESKSWGPALQLLYRMNKAVSLKEIAELLKWEEKYTGATLTNLMKKKHWPAPLVERPSKGKYRISGHGYTLMKRYEQLYGISIEQKIKPEEKLESEKKPTKLENFLKS